MKKINSNLKDRLFNEGKTDKETAIRNGGDYEKMKMKVKKIKEYNDKTPKGFSRIVNNAVIQPKIKTLKVNNMKLRKEIYPYDVKQNKIELESKDKNEKKKLNQRGENFTRIVNNLYRNEESVLDQSERLTHSVLIRRELSKNLNGMKFKFEKEIANKLRMAHLAEKKVIVDNEKEFMSRFTGPVKTLIEIPEIKQQLDEKQNIKKQFFGSDHKSNEAIKNIAKKIGLGENFLPSSREQAEIQREKSK